MTGLSEHLQALLDDEARFGPSPEAAERCWQRIREDVERGLHPEIDVPPPPPPTRTNGAAWLALVILGGTLAGGVLLASGGGAGPDTSRIAPPTGTAIDLDAEKRVADAGPALPSLLAPAPAAQAAASATPPEEVAFEPMTPPPDPTAPPSARRRPTTRPTDIDADTFAAELRLISQGQAALTREDYSEARKIADQYRKAYPTGHFREDGEALRVLSLCGSSAPARNDVARRFLRAHPRSIHATRVREACGFDPE